MTKWQLGHRLETFSAPLARDWISLAGPTDRAVRRRLAWVWGLLFLDILTYTNSPSNLLPIPSIAGKVITQGSALLALALILTVNKKLIVRPNAFLILLTVLCALAAVMSVRGYFGLGSLIRCGRFIVFLAAMWLTTPWWGRRDFMIFQFQRRALVVVLATVIAGMVISPGRAFAQAGGGRLGGDIWPIPPTQVAHYAAVLVGMTLVLWFAGMANSAWTGVVAAGGLAVLLLTHTRTALIALLAGLLVAGVSLFLDRRRVRRTFALVALVAVVVALAFSPFLAGWFTRGESAQELDNLTGRTNVWTELVDSPRTNVNMLLGYGLSNDSFNGLSIDSSWLATYQSEGLVGDVIDGMVLLTILVIALRRPPGLGRAAALFLVVYAAIASYTETGLGQPSAYFLDMAVAMSVLMPPLVVGTASGD